MGEYLLPISYDAASGISTEVLHDPTTGKSRMVAKQDVSGVLDYNTLRQTDSDGGWLFKDRSWRHAASIPNLVAAQWKTELGIDIYNKSHTAAIKRLLDDSDHLKLRIARFKLGRGDK